MSAAPILELNDLTTVFGTTGRGFRSAGPGSGTVGSAIDGSFATSVDEPGATSAGVCAQRQLRARPRHRGRLTHLAPAELARPAPRR